MSPYSLARIGPRQQLTCSPLALKLERPRTWVGPVRNDVDRTPAALSGIGSAYMTAPACRVSAIRRSAILDVLDGTQH